MSALVSHEVYSESGLDGNSTSTLSGGIDISFIQSGTLFICEASGDIAGAALRIEMSPDGTTWYDTFWAATGNYKWDMGPFVTGQKLMVTGESFSVDYIRIKVVTASTVASTFDIVLVGK